MSLAPRIALIVDHPSRDLPGLTLTAVELCRRGAICHLVPANLAWREVWALTPDFVLFNYFRRSNEQLGRGLAEAGIRFGVLDTEGGVWPDPANYAELLWQDRALLRRAECVCLWGGRMAEYLLAQEIFTEKQVVVTGCPRFDFYAPEWRSVLARNGGAASERPRVLVNTNFSTRNPRFTSVEKKIDTSRRNFGWSDDRIHELLRTEEAAIVELIRLCADLAHRFPAVDLVLRPHPFEDPAWYARELAGYPNVQIDGEGPVQPAIYGAAMVIQRSCTTAIEAGLAGTPTLSPQWVPAPLLMPAAEAVSIACHSQEELAQKVGVILQGNYRLPEQTRQAIDRITQDWFCASDGASYSRVAAAILRSLPSAPPRNLLLCDDFLFDYDLSGRPLSGLAGLGAWVRRVLRLPPEWSFRARAVVPATSWAGTSKFFAAEDVRALVLRLAEIMARRSGPIAPMQVELTRTRGDYRHGLEGHSVTLWSDGGPA